MIYVFEIMYFRRGGGGGRVECSINIKTKTIRGRMFLLFFLLLYRTQRMLRASQILPKLERGECVVSYVTHSPPREGGGGGEGIIFDSLFFL